jgi:hypothetical protein
MGFENLGVLELTPTTKYANARPDPDCTHGICVMGFENERCSS